MAGTVAEDTQKRIPAKALVRRKKRRVGIRIDMTPMVDVAFLLLIFFMVTTVFRRPLAMEINMPESEAKVQVPESNVLTVYVERDALLYSPTPEAVEPITWEELEPTFVAAAERNPQLIILVKIHREARYEQMVDMMDTLEDANMQRFSLVEMTGADVERLEALQ
jgi:biopolymer transport protein ExbD